MNDYEYSSTGLALTCSFEGLRLEAYQDSGGIWTVGYGHTGANVRAGQRISAAEAVALLRDDLASAVRGVRKAVRVPISQCRFDALVDFCFNAGRGNLLSSTLLHLVNCGDFDGAAGQFGLWVHAGGRVIPGLVRRRAAEAALFMGHGLPASVARATVGNPHPSTEVGVAEPGSALA